MIMSIMQKSMMNIIEEETDDDIIAQKAVDFIIAHYSQPIHLETDSDDIPYFDPILGKPLDHDIVIANWTDKLWSQNVNQCIRRIVSILGLYDSTLQEKCFSSTKKDGMKFTDNCHILLIKYEILLNTLLNKLENEPKCSKNDHADGLAIDYHKTTDAIRKSIFKLATSILSLISVSYIQDSKSNTGSEKNDKKGNRFILCNWILPILLRLINHSLSLLRRIFCAASPVLFHKENFQETLGLVLITVLSFCPNENIKTIPGSSKFDTTCTFKQSSYVNLAEILPSNWMDQFTLNHVIQTCAYPPPANTCTDVDVTNSDSPDILMCNSAKNLYSDILSKPLLNFRGSVTSSIDMPWLDNVEGVGYRSATSLLLELVNLSTFFNDYFPTAKPCKNPSSLQNFLEQVFMFIGLDYTLCLTRAHFFGRLDQHFNDSISRNDNYHYKDISSSTNEDMKRLNLNFPSKQLPTTFVQRRFENSRDIGQFMQGEISSKIPSVLRIISSIKFPQMTSNIIEQSLPIIYSLIDCNIPSHQCLGAATMLHILQECTPSAFVYSRQNDNKGSTFFETTVQVLALATRTCKDPIAFAILAKVRCRLFEVVGPITPVQQSGKLRRDAALEFFNLLKANRYTTLNGEKENESFLKSILIGGLHPILVQIANLPDAHAIEMFRVGLSALLPLIRSEFTSLYFRDIQIASLACLISLMIGAHPILERHAGKIMYELISCISRAKRDNSINGKVDRVEKQTVYTSKCDRFSDDHLVTTIFAAFAIHTASVALIIGNEKTNAILKEVEQGAYVPLLLSSCKQIRLHAQHILSEKSGI